MHEGKPYGLLLETAAPGRRVDKVIEAIHTFPPGDSNRKTALETARRMCLAIGAGLAEFHGLRPEQRSALGNSGLLLTKLEYDQLLTPKVKNRLGGLLDFQALNLYLKQEFDAVIDKKSYYRHGDADVKNIFYNPAKDRIILIDVARIHHWIDRAGRPLATNLQDLFHLHHTIVREAGDKLTKQELHLLTEAICSGYTDSAPLAPDNVYTAIQKVCGDCEDNRKISRLPKHIKHLQKIIQ